MLHLNYRDTRPIYEQIRDGLKKLIVSGAMAPDEKLPSVRSLATQLSINPNTIQRAYNELENEGYIYSIPGKGSFASADVESTESKRRALREKIRELAAELRYLGESEEALAALLKEEPAGPTADPPGDTGKEEPVKLVTEVLRGPKEEPVKLVTEMLGAPQRETVQAETGKEDTQA